MSNKGKSIERSIRSKETSYEFGRAGKGGQLIRTAFHRLIKDVKDHGQSGRLSARLLQVIQSDAVNDLGKRNISAGDLRLLEGFDFFKHHLLLRLIPTIPAVQVDRRHGKCVVSISSFVPEEWLPSESPATHITIVAAAAAVDFDRHWFDCQVGNSVPLAVHEETGVSFGFAAPKTKEHPIIVVVGVQFLKTVNGKSHPLAGLALQVVKVDVASRESGVRSRESGVQRQESGGRSRKSNKRA